MTRATPTPPASARRRMRPTLLAVLCAAAVAPAWAQQPDVPDAARAVTTLDRLDVRGERTAGYGIERLRAGTRMDLTPRQIPQSVSVITRERLDDQHLQTISDVLNNVTGVAGTRSDSERHEFYARGFYIDNFQFDGIPTTLEQAWSYGDAALDLALYERVEVVRGATGLLTGAGNPSASVNLVRKRADSREPTGTVALSLGRWSDVRTTVDATAPLNASGSVRARVVGSYQDTESHMERYEQRRTLGYAVIDADLGENTLLGIGYDHQKKESDGVTWGGFPLWFSDGSRTDYPVSFNPAADWTYWDTTVERAFVSLDHAFGNDWNLRLNATRDTTKADNKLFYPFYTIYGFDPDTGGGVVPYSGNYDTEREVDGADAYVEGPFRAFGREHQLVAGGSYNRREYVNNGAFDFPGPMPTYFDWTGQWPEPDWLPLDEQSSGTTTQRAAYAATRLSLTDPLTLILGARHTRWENDHRDADGSGGFRYTSREHSETTPYAGLVYDFDDTWSAYASYTDIFQPQNYRGADGAYLDPVLGKSYEIGVKSAWLDDRLDASLTVFRIEQDNVAQDTGELLPGTNENIFVAARGTVSEGFEFELNGDLSPGWNATFGAAHYTARDADGASINTQLPRTTIRLFTGYTPQGAWSALTVGGGVNWQNRTYYDDAAYGRFEQDPYALVSLFARYRMAPQFTVQLNLDNLLDERYHSQFNGGYGAWGRPRSGTMTFTYTF
ncbi:ferric-rhodotorulic acid/ferric-coprogen receptor FhuE [Luteimonas abyssi]|uniref:ferric-rhodotorulic acid/ferric-coprogen receptor FhuE n=1 Tax=Luteimonas abyssi TaxID=1247514 RepID=UPI000737C0B5|nr:ferric-rhodotorulic acid/ferric-coprogen receptor FhuE [Luteimonas abyssi]